MTFNFLCPPDLIHTPPIIPNTALLPLRMLFPEALQALQGGAWVALLVTAWVLWVSWRFNLPGSFKSYVYDKRYVCRCRCCGVGSSVEKVGGKWRSQKPSLLR